MGDDLTPHGPIHKVSMMPTMGQLIVLAQDDDSTTSAGGVILVCVFLLIVVLAAAYGVMWLRKRLWTDDDESVPSAGFTLGDLKQLHRAGKITDQEFQVARDKVLAAAHAAAEKNPAKPPPPTAR